MNRITALPAWLGVLVFIAWCLHPVLGDWSGSVLGPFGGIDPMLQLGILQWSCLHWHQPAVWFDLPIFHPLPGMLGCMDPLLGQAWLVWPAHLLFSPTAAAQYNLAMAGSLLLAALGMASVWLATGGGRSSAGFTALALIGAPYTISQLGHLNQLPPPFVLFCLAAAIMALRRQDARRRSWPWWSGVGAGLVLQAAWGWYGLAYALVGVATIKVVRLVQGLRRGDGLPGTVLTTAKAAWAPALATAGLVLLLAQPQLRLADRYPGFTRTADEVRSGSADVQHLLNRGAYRSGPADWLGRGTSGAERYDGRHRQTLNPGWVALALAAYGWRRRRDLDGDRRAWGAALLVMGAVGMILAFGDSVGLPGTDRRLPLPLEWLRAAVTPFKAFRGAWRFSWLFIIAVAWWAAVGLDLLAARPGRRRLGVLGAVVLLTLVSLPAGVPAVKVPLAGRPEPGPARGPVLTLPAPVNEYAEDRTEALWIARAIELGAPVTGGATGWVPPEIVAFRERLAACEQGREDAGEFLAGMRRQGYLWVELALREYDGVRVDFWRRALDAAGAEPVDSDAVQGYEMYRFGKDQGADASAP
ncbi:MAG: hypothetical protein ABIK96_07810 [bacterium]